MIPLPHVGSCISPCGDSSMLRWLERRWQRQRELQQGVDADLVRENRRRWKLIWCLFACGFILLGIEVEVALAVAALERIALDWRKPAPLRTARVRHPGLLYKFLFACHFA